MTIYIPATISLQATGPFVVLLQTRATCISFPVLTANPHAYLCGLLKLWSAKSRGFFLSMYLLACFCLF